jgi:hypothetical protein
MLSHPIYHYNREVFASVNHNLYHQNSSISFHIVDHDHSLSDILLSLYAIPIDSSSISNYLSCLSQTSHLSALNVLNA